MLQGEGGGVAAVDRAMSILRVIAAQATPMSLADIARETGLYKSTALRLIASLERASLVFRRTDGHYVLGSYAFALGRAYEHTHHLQEVLRPVLCDLVTQGCESASFHVYDTHETRLCILRIDSAHSTLDSVHAGDLLPMDRGAAGKLLRAFYGTGLRPDASNVQAVSMGERDPHCAAVAVAVFGAGDEMIGAISLSGPKERFTPAAIEMMTSKSRVAAAQVTRELGGAWPD